MLAPRFLDGSPPRAERGQHLTAWSPTTVLTQQEGREAHARAGPVTSAPTGTVERMNVGEAECCRSFCGSYDQRLRVSPPPTAPTGAESPLQSPPGPEHSAL